MSRAGRCGGCEGPPLHAGHQGDRLRFDGIYTDLLIQNLALQGRSISYHHLVVTTFSLSSLSMYVLPLISVFLAQFVRAAVTVRQASYLSVSGIPIKIMRKV